MKYLGTSLFDPAHNPRKNHKSKVPTMSNSVQAILPPWSPVEKYWAFERLLSIQKIIRHAKYYWTFKILLDMQKIIDHSNDYWAFERLLSIRKIIGHSIDY